MAEGIKSQVAKYATIAQLVAGIILYCLQVLEIHPTSIEGTVFYGFMLAALVLIYRKDKDYNAELHKISLTPQEEYYSKKALELFLSLLGFKATVERQSTPEPEPIPEPDPIVTEPTRDELLERLKELGVKVE